MDAKSQTLMECQLERLGVACKDIRDSQLRIAEAVERLMPRPIHPPAPTESPNRTLSYVSGGATGPGAMDALTAKIDLLLDIEKENREILAHLQRII